MRRAAHVLFHQQHRRRRLEIEPARIEAHALADDRHAGVFRIAPFEFDHARGMGAAGGAADHVDHREFAFQRIALGDVKRGAVRFGQAGGDRFEFGRTHVFGRGVDQIADQFGRGGLGQRGGDRLGVLGQQDARAIVGRVGAVTVEAVLPGGPAE